MKHLPTKVVVVLAVVAVTLAVAAISRYSDTARLEARVAAMETAVSTLRSMASRGDCDEMLEAFEVVALSRIGAQDPDMDGHLQKRFDTASIKATACLQDMRPCEQSSTAFANRLHQLRVAFESCG